ncbi:MAG: hypothetical protein EBT07_17720 [Actinobacteria bacterium]|nr:hypothetical protein [Actinomycetota bacterium]
MIALRNAKKGQRGRVASIALSASPTARFSSSQFTLGQYNAVHDKTAIQHALTFDRRWVAVNSSTAASFAAGVITFPTARH